MKKCMKCVILSSHIIIDNALYPILFYDCVVKLFASGYSKGSTGAGEADDLFQSGLENGAVRVAFIAVLTVVLTLLNLRGLDVVGNVTMVISLTPFVIFCVIGFPQVQTERLFVGKALYPALMYILLINLACMYSSRALRRREPDAAAE